MSIDYKTAIDCAVSLGHFYKCNPFDFLEKDADIVIDVLLATQERAKELKKKIEER